MKKLTSGLLVICMLLSLAPPALADNDPDTQPEGLYEICRVLDDGTVVSTPVSAEEYETEYGEARLAGVSDLPQIPTPTNLAWHENGVKGSVGFDLTGSEDTMYTITIYKDGEFHAALNFMGLGRHNAERGNVQANILINESGTYYFTVVAEGNGTTTSDSETARSGNFVYACPSARLGPATSLRLENTTANFKAVQGAGGYHIFLYKIDGSLPRLCGSTWSVEPSRSDIGGQSISQRINDGFFGESGYYAFTVQPLSPDITRIANGVESDLSAQWHYQKPSEYIGTACDVYASVTSDGTIVRMHIISEDGANNSYRIIGLTLKQANSMLGKIITFKKNDQGDIYDIAVAGSSLATVTFILN